MEDKYVSLKEAFSEKDFIEKIQNLRIKIENELSKFIKHINNEKLVGLKIFENLESRVKSLDSFSEKIKRKDYINTWTIPESKKDIQNLIESNLPDLIGFRINCFFYEDEEIIYNELKKYFENNMMHKDYYLNFNENKKQANGHMIYKVSGNYKNTNFEIQIKCSVHNIWGEVEHSRVYKSEHYDPKLQTKKVMTEEIFNILQSSDQQLMTVFKEKYSTKDLINSLFYQYTYSDIRSTMETTVLSKHYQHFFQIFKEKKHAEAINKYVAMKMIESECDKLDLEVSNPKNLDNSDFKKRYIPFDIEVVFQISLLIYNIPSKEIFMDYLIKIVENSSEDVKDEFDEPFSDEEDEENSKEVMKKNVFFVYDDYFIKREDEV